MRRFTNEVITGSPSSQAGFWRGVGTAVVVSPVPIDRLGEMKSLEAYWKARLHDSKSLADDWRRVGSDIGRAVPHNRFFHP